jgi:hypothetical protein
LAIVQGLAATFDIAPHQRAGQQSVDAGRLVKAFVGQKLDLGRIFQLQLARDFLMETRYSCAAP